MEISTAGLTANLCQWLGISADVIFTFQLCAIAFFLYLLNENNHKISKLKDELREKEDEIEKFNERLLCAGKRYASVVFKGSGKHYDYFLDESDDVQVGDFVEVWAYKPTDGYLIRKTIAKVKYISPPGRESKYAKSEIERKATYAEWLMSS